MGRRKLLGAGGRRSREAVGGSEGCKKARRARWAALAWRAPGRAGLDSAVRAHLRWKAACS
eukprot:7002783-Prymnesium_polylepis.2